MKTLQELVNTIKQDYVVRLLMEIEKLSVSELESIDKIIKEELKKRKNDKKI